ncbi:MAG: shikimate kinase [Planctomycetota bacterium]
MLIILLGYRASGKSTLGRLLADRLNLPFTDIDDAIRAEFNHRTVADIWATEGEPVYRAVEVQVMQQLAHQTNHVVALGGGTPMQPAAATAIANASNALRVYLHADAQTLTDRLTADTANRAQRPALTKATSLLEEITTTLADREPTYRRLADLTLDITQLTPTQATDHILSHLGSRL